MDKGDIMHCFGKNNNKYTYLSKEMNKDAKSYLGKS